MLGMPQPPTGTDAAAPCADAALGVHGGTDATFGADADAALRFHGDAEVGDGLVDLAVNVRTAPMPDWLAGPVTPHWPGSPGTPTRRGPARPWRPGTAVTRPRYC